MSNSTLRGRASVASALAVMLFAAASAGIAQQGVPFGVGGEHDPSQPVEITSESLSVDQAAGTAIFRGSVVVGQGQLRLGADEVEVFYAETAAGRTTADRIRAEGNVTVTNGEEAAEAARALYRVDDAVIEMDGDVILTQGPNAVAGDRLRIDLATGQGTMEGRVQTIILPDRDP